MKTGQEILKDVLGHTGLKVNALSNAIGLKRSQNLYDIESGKVKYISHELSEKIIKKFPEINRVYLLTGEYNLLSADPINTTAGSEVKTPLTDSAKFGELLAVLAEIGSKVGMWESLEEGRAKLHRRFYAVDTEVKATGTRGGADKNRK